MQIKTTMGYHLTLVRMVIIKKPKILKFKKKKKAYKYQMQERVQRKRNPPTLLMGM